MTKMLVVNIKFLIYFDVPLFFIHKKNYLCHMIKKRGHCVSDLFLSNLMNYLISISSTKKPTTSQGNMRCGLKKKLVAIDFTFFNIFKQLNSLPFFNAIPRLYHASAKSGLTAIALSYEMTASEYRARLASTCPRRAMDAVFQLLKRRCVSCRRWMMPGIRRKGKCLINAILFLILERKILPWYDEKRITLLFLSAVIYWIYSCHAPMHCMNICLHNHVGM